MDRGLAHLALSVGITLCGERGTNSGGEHWRIVRQAGTAETASAILQRDERSAQIAIAADTVQCERFPVPRVAGVNGVGKSLGDVAKKLSGASILSAIQGFTRQAIERISRVGLAPGLGRTAGNRAELALEG